MFSYSQDELGSGGAVVRALAGSNLRENFLNVTRAQCSTHVKRVSQHSGESRGFSARKVNLNCCKNS